jgi:hypothetical protein
MVKNDIHNPPPIPDDDWNEAATFPFLTIYSNTPWTRDTMLNVDKADLFLDTYGSAFGNRSTKCMHTGQTLYLGTRSTGALRMSPSSGPHDTIDSQYYRETYVLALQPICEKVTNRLVTLTCNFMQWSDPPVHNLLTEKKDALLSKAESKEIGRVHLITQRFSC